MTEIILFTVLGPAAVQVFELHGSPTSFGIPSII